MPTNPLSKPLRVAIIDIGSASIRSVAVEVLPSGERRVLAEDRAMTKLAMGLASTGLIVPEAHEASLLAIVTFVGQARALSCSVVRAFATSAVREAKNGSEFVRAVREATGRAGWELEVEVVTEEEEGLLALRSAASRVDLSRGRVAVADLGGGSLEVIVAEEGRARFNRSMPLGAVRLTDQFGGGEASSSSRFGEMEQHVRGVLVREVSSPASVGLLIASGGTLTTLGAMARAMRMHCKVRQASTSDDWAVHRSEVDSLLERVCDTPMIRRHEIHGLPRDRVEIIAAGLVVVRELMACLPVDSLLVNPLGLREGLLLKVIDDARRGSP